jgi:hypothetical protein
VSALFAKKFYDERYFCNANLYTINEMNIQKFLELNERDYLDWLTDQRIEILWCWKDFIKKSLFKIISMTISVLSSWSVKIEHLRCRVFFLKLMQKFLCIFEFVFVYSRISSDNLVFSFLFSVSFVNYFFELSLSYLN